MEKLSINRTNGDNFQFEDYIENKLKTLPKLEFNSNIFKSMI